MLQDEFKPISHKALTIGRSPKESMVVINQCWVKKITYKAKGGDFK